MPFPYVTHLYAAAFLLLDYTDDEDVIIATLLHDTLEDTDYTIDELQEDFGGRVREIVEAVTEPKTLEGRKLSWTERKESYIKNLKKGPIEACMVSAADKIHNFRTLVEDYHGSPDRFKQDFGDNFEERIKLYGEMAKVLNNRLDGTLLIKEFNHVFAEFQQFLYTLQNGPNDYS